MGRPKSCTMDTQGVTTQWCRHFFSVRGCERCHYCTFAHTVDQMGKKYFDRGMYDDRCKMVLCRYWAIHMHCRRGEWCTFAHGPKELGMPLRRGGRRAPAPAVPKTTSNFIPRDDESEWAAYRMSDGSWTWRHNNIDRDSLGPPPGFEQPRMVKPPGLPRLRPVISCLVRLRSAPSRMRVEEAKTSVATELDVKIEEVKIGADGYVRQATVAYKDTTHDDDLH